MPFVIPPSSTDLETLELDGLHLNSDEIGMEAVAFPPPRQRAEWIGAADSEWQALARNPLHENREITANLVVVGGDKDGMLQRVGEIVDKLQKASQYQDGIELVWSPGGSTLQVTFDVLSGQITEMAVDVEWNFSHVAKLTVVMTCKPYWRGEETLSSTTSGSLPALTAEIANLVGDIPALGRLIVTDTASQSRRHVEWGLEGPLTYNAATSLLVDSDDLVTSGFGGSGTTQTGAYDPNASGNNVVGMVARTTPVAMCGLGDLAHVGSFRVKARVYSDGTTVQARLSWRAADGPMSSNAWASHAGGWRELDLGVISIPAVIAGSQRWTGQIEAQTTSGAWQARLDYLELVPVTDGYGKARATYTYQTGGLLAASDGFDSTTAGSNLNGRVASIGGTWATSGDATDLQFADDLSGEQIKRSAASGTNGRFAVLGSTNYADTEVSARVRQDGVNGAGSLELGVIARWVDSSNHIRARFTKDYPSGSLFRSLVLEQVVAGTATTLATASSGLTGAGSNAWYTVRLLTFASGRAIALIFDAGGALLDSAEATSSALATGGALDDGKPGIFDRYTGTGTINRYYDDFQVSTPAAEPIVLYSGQSMEFRHDDTIREDSSGTYYGRPQSYRGSRFLVPVGTSRVLVKARRNDIDASTDDNVTDAAQLQVGVTPRGLVVPRS